MGLSCGEHDFDNRESEVPLIDESREQNRRRQTDMEIQEKYHSNGVEMDVEFWPVEHPMEPQDEDRPVKCPIPNSSVINEGRVGEERYGDSLRKRAELPTIVNKEGIVIVAADPPPFQAVRKRHHTLANNDDHIITMPQLPPSLPTHMLQQLDEFEC